MDILLLKKLSQLTDRVNQFVPLPAFGEHIEHNYGNTEDSVCQGNDPRLSDSRNPLQHTHLVQDLPSNLVTDSLQIIAGSGIIGGGDLSTNRTISHADTSNQPSLVLTANNEFVKGIQLDSFGHIVGITSGTTPPNINNYLSAVSGSGNGTITFNRDGLTSLSFNSVHNHEWMQVTNTPTTIVGYNITDAYTKTEIEQRLLEIPSGINIKDPVKVATTTNIMLTGLQTIDTVSLVVGDRVLVKNQSNKTQNGVYIVSETAWTRADELNEAGELIHGVFYYVIDGEINAASGWMLDLYNIANPTIGTTNLVFKQFFSASKYIAGQGLVETGNLFSVDFNVVSAKNHIHTPNDLFGGTLPVVNGGTGVTTLTAGQVLIGNGIGALTTLSRSGIDSRASFPPEAHEHDASSVSSGLFSVIRGGTGRSSLDTDKVLVGNGTNPVSLMARSGIDSRSSFPPAAHVHDANNITTGTLDESRLPITSDRLRKITISANNPTGGSNGDIWFKVY